MHDLCAEICALRHAGVRKESSGYALAEYAESGDLVDILIGSEGTLALFVGLELSLTAAAAATSSVLASFATLEDAAAAATRAAAAGAVACELLDRTFLELVAASSPHSSAEAVLLAEVEGASAADAVERARRLAETFTAQGATSIDLARDEAAEVELWSLRHAASPLLARLGPALRSMQFIEDGAVPPSRLPEYVRGVRAALDRQEIRGVIFGHAGDAHVHVNPLVETSRADWRARVGLLLDEVTSLVASLGGTVAGEHGDGRLRTPLMDRVWSREAMVEFARVKRAFDPHGILNPGVKVPGAGGSAELAIKYDPALPAPPAAAAAALRRVETERAYAADRLQLLEDAAPMP